jgi:shikimate 5-dehydrogenase
MTPEQIKRDTLFFGLVGDALEKTPLPSMINAFYDFNHLNAFCSIFNIRDDDVPFFLTNIKTKTIKGLFIQPSHTRKVLEYIDHFSPEAERSRSVDAIVIDGGKLHGENFKAQGIVAELKREGGVADKAIAIMGTDGSALAIASAVAAERPKKMMIVDPAPEAALEFSQKINAACGFEAFEIERCAAGVTADLRSAGVVINSLTLDASISFSDLKAGTIVYDCDGSFNGASWQKDVRYQGPYYMTLLVAKMMSERVFGEECRIDANFMESAEVIEIF